MMTYRVNPLAAWIFLLAFFLSQNGHAHPFAEQPASAAPDSPRVFTMDGKALAQLKNRIRERPVAYRQVLGLLRRRAGEYLDVAPYTITKKTSLPPSGDKHDYESQGPYWWPDPKSKDGLPYIRRDGERNPEIEKLTDHRYLSEMTRAVKILSLAFYLTGDERYGTKAAAFLRTWFIDPSTRMNPNLNFGQRIPGRTDGRDIGIIETRDIGEVTDAVGLLQGAKDWSASDQAGMEAWTRAYLDWLLHSENGKGEVKQHNNHGTWYDVQVTALALFTWQDDIARQALLRARDERLAKHIEPDGRQPAELARTRSWSYSVMNLQSFFTLATLG
ncbi:MAG TPA: alginate lyase family protein, partial [Chryseosolibacter sp.]